MHNQKSSRSWQKFMVGVMSLKRAFSKIISVRFSYTEWDLWRIRLLFSLFTKPRGINDETSSSYFYNLKKLQLLFPVSWSLYWDKCEECVFFLRKRKVGGRGIGKGRGRERELEVKLWQKQKNFANASAGNRTRDPSKRGWCSTIEPPRQATSPASVSEILSALITLLKWSSLSMNCCKSRCQHVSGVCITWFCLRLRTSNLADLYSSTPALASPGEHDMMKKKPKIMKTLFWKKLICIVG